MKIYVVVKSGVYRHEIVGVYSTLKLACEAAEAAAHAESDDYHGFEVLECTLDNPGEHLVAEVKRIDTRHWEHGRHVLDSTRVTLTYSTGVSIGG